MCQEIQLSDVRLALLDYCEEQAEDGGMPQPDDLLAEFDETTEDGLAHAFEHRRRARKLALRGDTAAAKIHEALVANLARARMLA